MISLRERQKLQTANAIRQVAVDLVHAYGLDDVTTEMISEKAGVSPRTFFNYFHYKEAALLPPEMEFSQVSVEKFVSGKKSLLDDMTDLVVPLIEFYVDNRTMLKKLVEISNSHPKLLTLKINMFQDFEDMVKGVIARRLNLDQDHEHPFLMAAITTTAIRISMERWAECGSGSPDEFIQRAFREIKTMFCE